MAAVLACGKGAALSHRSAAALWGIRPTARARIEVTVGGPRSSRPEIEIHSAALAPDELAIVDGIPLTTVPRTLLDLAAVVGRAELERAVNQAEVLRLGDALALEDLVSRYPGRRGVAPLRAVLGSLGSGADVTRSELEDRFLSFLAAAQLPRPQVNVVLEVAGRSIEADCVWPAQRLVVELDGHATHATRAAYERDRARDRVLQAAGWRVVRVTWRQLHESPDALAADLSSLATLPRR